MKDFDAVPCKATKKVSVRFSLIARFWPGRMLPVRTQNTKKAVDIARSFRTDELSIGVEVTFYDLLQLTTITKARLGQDKIAFPSKAVTYMQTNELS